MVGSVVVDVVCGVVVVTTEAVAVAPKVVDFSISVFVPGNVDFELGLSTVVVGTPVVMVFNDAVEVSSIADVEVSGVIDVAFSVVTVELGGTVVAVVSGSNDVTDSSDVVADSTISVCNSNATVTVSGVVAATVAAEVVL